MEKIQTLEADIMKHGLKQQFIGRPFKITTAAILIAFLLGFFVVNTPFSGIVTVLIGLVTLLISLKKLEFGMFIALAELITTSHGHLFSLSIDGFQISVRMIIFLAVMIAWFIKYKQKRTFNFYDTRLFPYYLLFIALILGAIIGFKNNEAKNVFDDANGYLFAFYIFPMLSIQWDSLKKRMLLQVAAASSICVSFLTLTLLYLFTHTSEPIQRALYTYVRDTRYAELTRVSGDIFRVFIQSQFFVIIMVLILASAMFWFWKEKRDKNFIAMGIIIGISAIIISLSRSFWLGLLFGIGTLEAIKIKLLGTKLKIDIKRWGSEIIMVITSLALLWILLSFPFPKSANITGFGDLLSNRTQTNDVAVSSRWNLLPEMVKAGKKSPILGSGFGTVVAFESDDPRVREIYPDGKWRTYRFEWGWHDLWLKMGILGPIAFIWLAGLYANGLFRGFKQDDAWLRLGLFAGLIALYIIHIFSPYLNHPIGIGYLIFLTPFIFPTLKIEPVFESIKEVIVAKAKTTGPSPVVTLKGK